MPNELRVSLRSAPFTLGVSGTLNTNFPLPVGVSGTVFANVLGLPLPVGVSGTVSVLQGAAGASPWPVLVTSGSIQAGVIGLQIEGTPVVSGSPLLVGGIDTAGLAQAATIGYRRGESCLAVYDNDVRKLLEEILLELRLARASGDDSDL